MNVSISDSRCIATLPSAMLSLAVLALVTPAQAQPTQPGHTTAPLVQDTFSLAEPFDPAAPPALAAAAAETQAALMVTSLLTLTETTASINATPTLGELWQLCDGEAFSEQPTAAFCAGTLVAPDLLLTAEHCVPDKRSCRALSVVFDYRYTSAGVLAPLERDDVYACSKIVVSSSTADYALIQLDRAVVGRTPATPRFTDPSTCLGVDMDNDRVWAAGFPAGVPLKLDLGDRGADDAAIGVEIKDDSVTSRNFFRAQFDLFAGMDGGGVFNSDAQLVGFLSLGRADYARTDASCYAAVTVNDSGSELAGHVIQALVALCNKTPDYPSLCPATVSGCPPANMAGADAGVRAFPPQQSCGCRVPSPDGVAPPASWWVLLVSALTLRLRRRRRALEPR